MRLRKLSPSCLRIDTFEIKKSKSLLIPSKRGLGSPLAQKFEYESKLKFSFVTIPPYPSSPAIIVGKPVAIPSSAALLTPTKIEPCERIDGISLLLPYRDTPQKPSASFVALAAFSSLLKRFPEPTIIIRQSLCRDKSSFATSVSKKAHIARPVSILDV